MELWSYISKYIKIGDLWSYITVVYVIIFPITKNLPSPFQVPCHPLQRNLGRRSFDESRRSRCGAAAPAKVDRRSYWLVGFTSNQCQWWLVSITKCWFPGSMFIYQRLTYHNIYIYIHPLVMTNIAMENPNHKYGGLVRCEHNLFLWGHLYHGYVK